MPVGLLLADQGFTKSLSRPYVSNDNPYSEAHFKTLKYQPDFPERFRCREDASSFCENISHWYNAEHDHSGNRFITQEDVHYARVEQIIKELQVALNDAVENIQKDSMGNAKTYGLTRDGLDQ